MDVKYQVICEWVERDLLHLKRIHTSINLADLFTKHLGPLLFHRHTDYVMGHIPPHYAPVQTTASPPIDKPAIFSTTPEHIVSTVQQLGSLWSTISHNPFAAKTDGQPTQSTLHT